MYQKGAVLVFLHLLLSKHWAVCETDDEPRIIDSMTFDIGVNKPGLENPLVVAEAPPSAPLLLQPRLSQTLNAVEQSCPGIICFIGTLFNNSIYDGKSIFDCRARLPSVREEIMVLHVLECSFWRPPSAALLPVSSSFFKRKIAEEEDYGGNEYENPIRVRLRPDRRTADGPQGRARADFAIPGALGRLCETLHKDMQLATGTQLKVSLMMVQIKVLDYQDLATLFSQNDVTELILWNPRELAETSFLPRMHKDDSNFRLKEHFVRLTIYCEAGNDEPAFGRLWMPWKRWQIKFKQCKGQYSCHPWEADHALCCEGDRCLNIPRFAVAQSDHLHLKSLSNLQNYAEQILSYYTCVPNSSHVNIFIGLKRERTCWAWKKTKAIDHLKGSESIDHTSPTVTAATRLLPLPTPATSTAFKSDSFMNTTAIAKGIIRHPALKTKTTKANDVTHPRRTSMGLIETTVTTKMTQEIEQETIRTASESDKHSTKLHNLVFGIVLLMFLNVVSLVFLACICCWIARKRTRKQRLCQATAATIRGQQLWMSRKPQIGASTSDSRRQLLVPNSTHSLPYDITGSLNCQQPEVIPSITPTLSGAHAQSSTYDTPVPLICASEETNNTSVASTSRISTSSGCAEPLVPPSLSAAATSAGFLRRFGWHSPWKGRRGVHTIIFDHVDDNENFGCREWYLPPV